MDIKSERTVIVLYQRVERDQFIDPNQDGYNV
jgi:hypothetical protein